MGLHFKRSCFQYITRKYGTVLKTLSMIPERKQIKTENGDRHTVIQCVEVCTRATHIDSCKPRCFFRKKKRSNPAKQMKPYLSMTQEDLNSLSRLILSFVAYFFVSVDSTLWQHSADNQEGSSFVATSPLFIKEVYIFSKMENLSDPDA